MYIINRAARSARSHSCDPHCPTPTSGKGMKHRRTSASRGNRQSRIVPCWPGPQRCLIPDQVFEARAEAKFAVTASKAGRPALWSCTCPCRNRRASRCCVTASPRRSQRSSRDAPPKERASPGRSHMHWRTQCARPVRCRPHGQPASSRMVTYPLCCVATAVGAKKKPLWRQSEVIPEVNLTEMFEIPACRSTQGRPSHR